MAVYSGYESYEYVGTLAIYSECSADVYRLIRRAEQRMRSRALDAAAMALGWAATAPRGAAPAGGGSDAACCIRSRSKMHENSVSPDASVSTYQRSGCVPVLDEIGRI